MTFEREFRASPGVGTYAVINGRRVFQDLSIRQVRILECERIAFDLAELHQKNYYVVEGRRAPGPIVLRDPTGYSILRVCPFIKRV